MAFVIGPDGANVTHFADTFADTASAEEIAQRLGTVKRGASAA
jgi:hypothetical protein